MKLGELVYNEVVAFIRLDMCIEFSSVRLDNEVVAFVRLLLLVGQNVWENTCFWKMNCFWSFLPNLLHSRNDIMLWLAFLHVLLLLLVELVSGNDLMTLFCFWKLVFGIYLMTIFVLCFVHGKVCFFPIFFHRIVLPATISYSLENATLLITGFAAATSNALNIYAINYYKVQHFLQPNNAAFLISIQLAVANYNTCYNQTTRRNNKDYFGLQP